jgi:phosphatidylglycerol---prolipoprotein diacylglyceryl transferase
MMHPQFDPVALSLGPISIKWYGLTYLLAFALFYFLGNYRLKHTHYGKLSGLKLDSMDDILFYGVLGVIVGGRVGWLAFYSDVNYFDRPLAIFEVWKGGMSFHGGLVGVLVAMYLYARKQSISYWTLMDFVAPLVPTGLASGRLGNFINGELWGRPTTGPWAMIFPQSGTNDPRHASQLYQLGLEGLLLFALLWWYSSKPRPTGHVAGMFAVGYAVFRFIVEFAREPDRNLGVLAGGMTMGQWLCLPLFLVGIGLLLKRQTKPA